VDESILQRLEKAYNADSREELYYRIGLGTLTLDDISEVLKRSSSGRLSWLKRVLRLDTDSQAQHETYIIGSSEPDAPRFAIATCCNPIPGDPVTGFKSPDGQVTIHKKTCPVAESIAATHGDWVVVPKWLEQAEDSSFLVRIALKGIDRMGLLNDISRYVSLVMEVNMRKLSLSAEGGVCEGFIDLYVNNRDVLDRMIRKLSSIDGIQNVTRIDL